MTDVGRWLRDADPLARDEVQGLSPLDRQAMRRAMLTALDARTTAPVLWPHPLAIAATVALTLAAGVIVGRRLPPPRETQFSATLPLGGTRGGQPGVDARAENVAAVARRQLQFATPGGTRVIWVFDPEFEP